MLTRLNKYLSQLGIASRRKVDEMIAERKITVNGTVAELGTKVDGSKDTIKVGKTTYSPEEKARAYTYYMVYKPVGYVSTTSDPEGRPVVTSLVQSEQRLYPVGRLDVESEGLILLTNDGELTQKLTHPSHHMPKTYHVWVSGNFTENAFDRIRSGLRLKHERVAPADVEIIEEWDGGAKLEIILHQGMNRQIRRMMKAINLEVSRLERVAVGSVKIGNLKPGRARLLSKAEVESLKADTASFSV